MRVGYVHVGSENWRRKCIYIFLRLSKLNVLQIWSVGQWWKESTCEACEHPYLNSSAATAAPEPALAAKHKHTYSLWLDSFTDISTCLDTSHMRSFTWTWNHLNVSVSSLLQSCVRKGMALHVSQGHAVTKAVASVITQSIDAYVNVLLQKIL